MAVGMDQLQRHGLEPRSTEPANRPERGARQLRLHPARFALQDVHVREPVAARDVHERRHAAVDHVGDGRRLHRSVTWRRGQC